MQVEDIYTSPVMPKLMPSLRHTKSEEHLDCVLSVAAPKENNTNEKPSSTAATAVQETTKTASAFVSLPVPSRSSSSTQIAASPASVASLRHPREWSENGMTEDDVWSQEDDEITAQYIHLHKIGDRDAMSQMSLDSIDSREQSTYNNKFLF